MGKVRGALRERGRDGEDSRKTQPRHKAPRTSSEEVKQGRWTPGCGTTRSRPLLMAILAMEWYSGSGELPWRLLLLLPRPAAGSAPAPAPAPLPAEAAEAAGAADTGSARARAERAGWLPAAILFCMGSATENKNGGKSGRIVCDIGERKQEPEVPSMNIAEHMS